jgi:hypothetical protein
MTEQPPALAEKTDSNQRQLTSQKLEGLLRALNQLKSEISGVEARHPGFGSELSSLCDTVIAELDSLNSNSGEGRQAERDNINITIDNPAATGEPLPPLKQNVNPISSVVDKAGSHLITGLDKTGDGIIFILEKLFTNRVAKAKSITPAEAEL